VRVADHQSRASLHAVDALARRTQPGARPDASRDSRHDSGSLIGTANATVIGSRTGIGSDRIPGGRRTDDPNCPQAVLNSLPGTFPMYPDLDIALSRAERFDTAVDGRRIVWRRWGSGPSLVLLRRTWCMEPLGAQCDPLSQTCGVGARHAGLW
jgi:hypothetical protein